jgi:hypothetical protein
MASTSILGLFTSPEEYQRQQDLMMQRQAAELAQLDPYQSVRFGAIRAGQQFGRGLAGILGAEDPQLRMISTRQSALRGINLGDPESIFTAAQQLADAGDQQGALMLADYGRKAQADAALVTQRSREARAAATPKELQIAAARAQLQGAIRELEAMPPSPERDAQLQTAKDTLASLPAGKEQTFGENREAKSLELYNKPFSQLTTTERKAVNDAIAKPEKDLRFGVDREAVAEEVYGKPFAQLDQTQKAAVNKRVDEESNRRAKSSSPTLTVLGQGKEGAKDIPAFRDKVIGTIDPFRKTVTAADTAITNINDSLKTSNFASFRAAQTQFARAISGAGDLSQKELKAAGADPSLLGGTADYLSTFFTSTPTADTQKKLLSTLKAIRTVAAKKAREEISNQKKIATRAGYTEDDTALIFNFPEFEQRKAGGGAGKERTVTLKSGKTVTVVED